MMTVLRKRDAKWAIAWCALSLLSGTSSFSPAFAQEPAEVQASAPVFSEVDAAVMERLQTLELELARLRTEVQRLPALDDEYTSANVLAPAAAAPAKSAEKPKFPSVTVNGVFQADGGVFHQDAASKALTADPRVSDGNIQNGAEFRRARLSAKGSVTPNTNYMMQMDFGFFGRPTFTDVWMEQTELPVFGNVRVGQWKQPFSLEVVSSFRYTTFMERSLLFQAFTPFRHIGVGFYDYSEDKNTTWAASLIRTGQDQYGNSLSTNGGNGLVSRVTHVFGYDEKADGGSNYFHTGFGYYLNSPPRDGIRFRTVPEIFIGEVAPDAPLGTSRQPVPGPQNGTPFLVDTGTLASNMVNTIGWEGLLVRGPLSVQSEIMGVFVDRPGAGSTNFFNGAYVQAGYFLTGEHRPYDRKAGAIDRIKPNCDFFWHKDCVCHGWGAWEVAGRWSYIDLTDDAVIGGTQNDATLGVNWYTNPYTKLVFNYIHAWVDRPLAGGPVTGVSELNTFAGMAQIDF